MTRIPVRRTEVEPGDLGRASAFFPLVGLGVAGAGIVIRATTQPIWGAGVATVAAVGAMIVVTGALHEDGLADTADGLWGAWNRAGRLAIMRDSRIGTYGTIAIVVAIGLKIGLLLPLGLADFARAVACGHVLGRASTLVLARLLPSADAAPAADAPGQPGPASTSPRRAVASEPPRSPARRAQPPEEWPAAVEAWFAQPPESADETVRFPEEEPAWETGERPLSADDEPGWATGGSAWSAGEGREWTTGGSGRSTGEAAAWGAGRSSGPFGEGTEWASHESAKSPEEGPAWATSESGRSAEEGRRWADGGGGRSAEEGREWAKGGGGRSAEEAPRWAKGGGGRSGEDPRTRGLTGAGRPRLGTSVIGPIGPAGMVTATVVVGATVVVATGAFAVIPLAAGLAVCFGCAGLFRRRLGGFTGDTLGAATQLVDLAVIAAVAALARAGML
jgi:cobalamin synthase